MSRFGLRRARETFEAFPRPFWTLVLGTFIDRLGSHMLFPFFALYLTARFGVGMTQVAFLFATWSVVSVVGATAGGALADRFGRRGIVIFGLVASGASSLLLARRHRRRRAGRSLWAQGHRHLRAGSQRRQQPAPGRRQFACGVLRRGDHRRDGGGGRLAGAGGDGG